MNRQLLLEGLERVRDEQGHDTRDLRCKSCHRVTLASVDEHGHITLAQGLARRKTGEYAQTHRGAGRDPVWRVVRDTIVGVIEWDEDSRETKKEVFNKHRRAPLEPVTLSFYALEHECGGEVTIRCSMCKKVAKIYLAPQFAPLTTISESALRS